MVKSILLDEKKVFPCCCYLEGEYGQEDLCIGVPAVIGKRGCEKILKYELTADEQAAFEKSAAAVKHVNNVLYETNVLTR
jgi:malate dehydrogenase